MEWFDTNVASRDAALQQTPEVFESISVNLPINVFLGMVNDLVSIVLSQSVIGLQARRNKAPNRLRRVLSHENASRFSSDLHNHSADLAPTFQCTEHNGFVFSASTSDAALAFVEMHVAGFAADEGFVYLDVTGQFAAELLP